MLPTDHLLYGIAVRQGPEASPVIQPCARGTTRTHGDDATSGTSVSLPGRGMESADDRTEWARTALDCPLRDAMYVYCLLVCSVSVCLHDWLEAPQRIPGAWLACGIVCVCVRDLCACHTLHRVRDTMFLPSAGERSLWRVYGPWLSSLWLAPVCCAYGAKTPHESWGSCGDCARPCAKRAWRDCGPADCPWSALCRH